jgi:hypothetical protein
MNSAIGILGCPYSDLQCLRILGKGCPRRCVIAGTRFTLIQPKVDSPGDRFPSRFAEDPVGMVGKFHVRGEIFVFMGDLAIDGSGGDPILGAGSDEHGTIDPLFVDRGRFSGIEEREADFEEGASGLMHIPAVGGPPLLFGKEVHRRVAGGFKGKTPLSFDETRGLWVPLASFPGKSKRGNAGSVCISKDHEFTSKRN